MRRLVIWALLLGNAWAQSPAFDAASIKLVPPDHSGTFPYRLGPGSLSIRSSLNEFIQTAYDVRDYQVAGGQPWVKSDWYAVSAKAAGEADQRQIRMMFQALLAERFQLKLHHETRMMQGYVLSVEKGGPKLPAPKTDVAPGTTGVLQMGGGIWSRGSTIDHLAYGLRLELGEPVLNETGIEGNYDFRLRFDDSDAMGPGTPNAPQGLGSVFTALHEIGLKLDARKVPIDVLVIDSAERPSEN